MLYQLQDSMDWESFSQDKSRHCGTSQAIAKLSEVTGTGQRDMFVILCVDNLQYLNHENGTKHSDFHVALSALSDIVNASRCWVIAICSTTVSSPVYDFLAVTSQWIYQVPTATLSRPTVKGEDIFTAFNGNKLVELLIADMGGFSSALEILSLVLKENRRTQFLPVLTAVLSKLRAQYPGIEIQMEDMQAAYCCWISMRIH
ncbi:hypothetical protein V7S43_007133 [Phytophthora oleae]|uniref:Uncharacterized protein n=1 Tax=Phytophthora oleae TaxID=2107226 RepID=A0ABD3FRD6_9STRA